MKYLLCFVTTIFFSIGLYAQNNSSSATDAQRIAISPKVRNDVPLAAQKLLLDKLTSIITKNGLAGITSYSLFTLNATTTVLSKTNTATAPPMVALSLSIGLTISDSDNNNVYSQTSLELKGVGENENKAYIEAIKTLNVSNSDLKVFVENGKGKILEFYNSNCDFFIAKANSLIQQGNSSEALFVLNSVPTVCKDCYLKCMTIAATIQPKMENSASSTIVPVQ